MKSIKFRANVVEEKFVNRKAECEKKKMVKGTYAEQLVEG